MNPGWENRMVLFSSADCTKTEQKTVWALDYAQFEELGVIDRRRLHPAA
jgi:hypothetical protein